MFPNITKSSQQHTNQMRRWSMTAIGGTVFCVLAMSPLISTGQEVPPDNDNAARAVPSDNVAMSAMADVGQTEQASPDSIAAHSALFVRDRYPSATACAECHPNHYRQWSVSQHAYAQMSPIFNAMSGKIVKLTNGTNGDFCVRCHTQVGMNLGEAEFMSNIDRNPTSREGISCVICHRVDQAYGKLSGRLHLVEGPIVEPIYGPRGDPNELQRMIKEAALVTDKDAAGRKVHGDLKRFFSITTPGFCGSCHDVTLANGFRLEEAFSEYKGAPASRKGISCHDCHMGVEPGRIVTDRSDPDFETKNYAFGPAAVVGNKETAARKLTNHMFVGPDYSVLPPSLFPLHARAIKEESEKNDPKARGLATIREWLTFDWKAGWGTDAFENNIPSGYKFPERWTSADDRFDARAIVEDNLKLLSDMKIQRRNLLRTGYVLGDIVTDKCSPKGISFKVQVKNGTDGHNVPTGFDAERLVWLNVRVVDADGNVVHQSGDLDPNGDVRDLHSAYVHNHELPLDRELFSLQSKFITRNVRGGEREQVLAVNYSASPLPFIRPEPFSTVLIGRPAGARKQKMGIEPGGSRWPTYTVKESQLTGKWPYKAVVQLKAAMVPVNLVNEIRDVGFDYNMSARTIAENLVHGYVDADGKVVIWRKDSSDPEDNRVVGHMVLWEREVQFDLDNHQGR